MPIVEIDGEHSYRHRVYIKSSSTFSRCVMKILLASDTRNRHRELMSLDGGMVSKCGDDVDAGERLYEIAGI